METLRQNQIVKQLVHQGFKIYLSQSDEIVYYSLKKGNLVTSINEYHIGTLLEYFETGLMMQKAAILSH